MPQLSLNLTFGAYRSLSSNFLLGGGETEKQVLMNFS